MLEVIDITFFIGKSIVVNFFNFANFVNFNFSYNFFNFIILHIF